MTVEAESATKPSRSARRAARRAKRVERIDRVQGRLKSLRGKKEEQKRNLVSRVIRFILLVPVVIGLGALAFALRVPELLELPLKLMANEVKGTINASSENTRLSEELKHTKADAQALGLEAQGLMIVEESAGTEGALSVAPKGGEADPTAPEDTV